MSTNSVFRNLWGARSSHAIRSQAIILAAILGAAAPRSEAQNATAPGQGKARDATAIDYGRTLENAKALAHAKNGAGAEAALMAMNVTRAGTGAWHLEAAQRLVQLADALVTDAHGMDPDDAIKRALQHLNQADVPSNDLSLRVAAKLLAGFIQERFVGNSSAALACYQAAADLDPGSPHTKEALERRRRTDDAFRQPGNAGGK